MSRCRRLLSLTVLVLLVVVCAFPYPGLAKAGLVTTTLGGTDRYLGHVALDKPIYRTGEPLFARVTVLHAMTRKPWPSTGYLGALVEVRGPKGEIVHSSYVNGADGLLGFRWDIPDGLAGGEYTLAMTFPDQGLPPAERTFDIRVFRAPRLKSQIVFLRDGYGPGDQAAAALHVERAEGGFPAGAKVTPSVLVDGRPVTADPATVDGEGNATVRFTLPAAIERCEGTLALTIEDGGTVETAAKTIPILLQTLDVQVYPEGGDLVNGLPGRIYVEARTPAKKPADFSAVIEDQDGREAGRLRTEHEGRGRAAFTPVSGKTYRLRITEPAGLEPVPLPAPVARGVVLTARQDSTAPGKPVALRVAATDARPVTVTLSQREVELDKRQLDLKAGAAQDLELKPGEAAGVLTATVWSADNRPLAERLVFVQPAHRVRVRVTPDAPTYTPGSPVRLTVRAEDEAGKPVAALVGVTVTDDSVLEMIEKREQPPRLPAMAFLEPEVAELRDAHLYLDGDDPKALTALDLLLGTQGWRRFALVDVVKFMEKYGNAARRLFAVRLVLDREQAQLAGAGGDLRLLDEGADFGAAPRGVMMDGAPPPAPAPAGHEGRGADAFAEPAAAAALVMAPPADMDVVARPAEPAPEQEAMKEVMERAKPRGGLFLEKKLDIMAGKPAVAYVREFAHQARPDRRPGERVDFTETLFWHAGLKTDPRTGLATCTFELSDSVTSFRVLADAFTSEGALGDGSGTVEAVEPFNLEPKLPLEVTAGDQLQIPVTLINRQASPITHLAFTVTAGDSLEPGALPARDLPAGARERVLLPVYVGSGTAPTPMTIEAAGDGLRDKVTRTVGVRPSGFPLEVPFGGLLSAAQPARHEFTIPHTIVQGSMKARATVFPTPLGNLTAALERMLVEPSGCFEQTSSTNFPLVMAQQYFQTHTGVAPALVTKGQELLEKGYQRLVGFECKQKGYEWFGGDPGHEALTAYGLLEFVEMSRVRKVDQAMLERTRAWLLGRRDGKGGFLRNDQALDSFGRAPAEITDAYIVWALLEAGETGLDKEVAQVRSTAGASADPYLLALAGNILQLAGEAEGARPILGNLAKRQAGDGSVPGAATSITMSGGEALTIETTALAVLAWLRMPEFTPNVERGLQFLNQSCKDGRFGSTQSTILALRAILAYDQARARPKAAGQVQLLVDGQPVGGPVGFDEKAEGAIALPGFAERLKPGRHTVELRMTDGSEMPYGVTVTFHAFQPASAKECKLTLTTALAAETVAEGAVTEARVGIANRTKDVCPMPVAIIGLPGGLEPRHDQLKELVKAGTIDAYEVLGREVVLYWRAFKPEEKRSVNLSLVAAIPGTYTGPAARAYLYYTDEHKTWVPGLRATVTPLARTTR
ncbi:MAG: A-macroglobulin complement component [Candidatus Riflebacteria bacterium]|nr:A-macroglobulin complement component [Candidatus Riflebacteria bacterium]